MSAPGTSLLLAFYGDDLTGSTDSLEALTLAGIRSVLFLEPPGPGDLKRYKGIRAVGVAGTSRAMKAGAMEATLRPAFSALGALGPRHLHYKICSTFDSSAAIGSVGRALDVGADLFPSSYTPVLGGAPALGRYCAFGNLFARADIGAGGKIYRLDRHPSMSRHPVTPATESDLQRHLSLQTQKQIALFDVLNLTLPFAEARSALNRLVGDGAEVVLFDALYPEHLELIGELIDAGATGGRPLFSVGPSSVEVALGARWRAAGKGGRFRIPRAGRSGKPILVASGSCSAVTEDQINWALGHGFAGVGIDTAFALRGDGAPAADSHAIASAVSHLRTGLSVVLHTSRGASDARVAAARALMKKRSLPQELVTSRLGAVLGLTAREILKAVSLPRVAVAGGDSSSYAARALGIESLEMIATLTPGGPLCRARAPGSPIDGREIVFKGGQVGGRDYFGLVAAGPGKR